MAQLGERQGVSQGVRDFAAAAVTEQRASDNGLMVYAQQKNMDRVQVALPGGALEHGVLLRAPIANSPPNQFDYRFMSQVVADRQGVIDAATAAQLETNTQRFRAAPDDVNCLGETGLRHEELDGACHVLDASTLNPVPLPAFPTSVSRTNTGADQPPPEALKPGALNR